MIISKRYIKTLLNTYSCDIKRNDKCNKKYCICNGKDCKRTTEYKYAKKTLINKIKRIINKLKDN